ncbi:hypothetical protein BH10ACI3_BH10ACI3_16680 [soil metagenome]
MRLKNLAPLSFLVLMFMMSCSMPSSTTNSVITSQTSNAITPKVAPVVNGNTQTPVLADYKDPFASGAKEGRIWAKDPSQGMPYQLALDVMSKGFAEKNSKTGNDAWRNAWIDGFKSGFSTARGGKGSASDDPQFEPISWVNISIGEKLYDNDKKHEVTVTSLDEASGLINVKYVKSGRVEPKRLENVSRFWFVKKY